MSFVTTLGLFDCYNFSLVLLQFSIGHFHITILIVSFSLFKDPRFNKEVDKKTGYRTKSILCMPILDYDGQVLGIAQIMNKTDDSDEFSPDDEKVNIIYS